MSKYIILFDGVCNFCNFWINFILKNDRKGVFLFAPLQSEAGKHYLNKFGLHKTVLDTIILILGNNYFTRSDAVLEIAKNLPYPSKMAVIFRILPHKLRDALYDIIARNRYKWFGKRDLCRIPTPEEKSRFLV